MKYNGFIEFIKSNRFMSFDKYVENEVSVLSHSIRKDIFSIEIYPDAYDGIIIEKEDYIDSDYDETTDVKVECLKCYESTVYTDDDIIKWLRSHYRTHKIENLQSLYEQWETKELEELLLEFAKLYGDAPYMVVADYNYNVKEFVML
jgi:hypothetical protein